MCICVCWWKYSRCVGGVRVRAWCVFHRERCTQNENSGGWRPSGFFETPRWNLDPTHILHVLFLPSWDILCLSKGLHREAITIVLPEICQCAPPQTEAAAPSRGRVTLEMRYQHPPWISSPPAQPH